MELIKIFYQIMGQNMSNNHSKWWEFDDESNSVTNFNPSSSKLSSFCPGGALFPFLS